MTQGPVIIYDWAGAESNDFLRKIYSRPTRHAEKKFCGLLDIARKILMPTVIGKNKHVL